MSTITLNKLAEISSGQGAPQGEKCFGHKGLPFVRAGSLDFLLSEGKEDDLERVSEEVANEYQLKPYLEGTILFAKSGMSATKDRVYALKSRCYVVNHLAAIIPKKPVDSDFLKFWFRHFRPSHLIKDKAYPSIRLADIEKIKVPDFSDEKKRHIIFLFEKSESAKQKRQEANRLTEEFLKSAFVEMFGDIVKNSKNWIKSNIGDLITNPVNENPNYFVEKIYEYIDISCIDNKAKVISAARKIEGASAPSRARQLVEQGDILVSTVRPNLNAVALVPHGLTNPIASTGFCILRSKSDLINHFYLFEVCKTSFFVGSLTKNAKGANYPAVTDNDVKNILIPVPPLDLQQKFADLAQKVEALKIKQRESEKEIDNLFNSLMQKAFKGELNYQNG